MLADFVTAVRFLTLLPIPLREKSEDLAQAMLFFPLVGFLIGILSLAVMKIFSFQASDRLAALALVTLPLLFTGGLHLDGLADFADGFFAGKTREQILEIMRDSHVGVWGILAVVLILFWKWELLIALSARPSPFLFSLTASRWAQVVLAYFLPYARPESGLGEAVAKKVSLRVLIAASAFLTLLVFFLGRKGVLGFIALLPFLAALGFFFFKRVGGITGDLLGAVSEMTEVFVLLCFFLMGSVSFS